MKLVAQVKLVVTAEQRTALLATLRAANAACDVISEWAWGNRKFKQFDLHHGNYYAVREQFGISSQVAVRCVAKVADSYKLDKDTKRTFKPTGSIAFDSRILRFLFDKQSVSLWTINGRITVPYQCGEHQAKLLGKQKGECDLCFVEGQFYLLATCETEELPLSAPNGFIGVDLGIVELATDSEGENFTGEPTRAVRRRFRSLRKGLQKCGRRNRLGRFCCSKSAKRHLQKVRRRESRFAKWVNHGIAKRLVEKAKTLGKALALETLTGIRDRGNSFNRESGCLLRKHLRWQLGSWGFHQLGLYITYKAQKAGVPVVWVNPAYSSRTCSVCQHCDKANRKSQACFHCQNCGFQANADYNAALNLKARGEVTRPMVATLKQG